jgi:hypothetical protein
VSTVVTFDAAGLNAAAIKEISKPTPKELHEAAHHIIRTRHPLTAVQSGEINGADWEFDERAERLARHVLDTVRLDDDEPITNAWLMRTKHSHRGTAPAGNVYYRYTIAQGEECKDQYGYHEYLQVSLVIATEASVSVRSEVRENGELVSAIGVGLVGMEYRTRGQLRSLCKALGVDLGEPTRTNGEG